MDVRTVARSIADAGMTPLSTRGRAKFYNSADALKAIYRTGESAKERLDAARAEIAEIDLAERRGEVLPHQKVLAHWQKLIAAFRARMLAIPSKIAGQFAPPGKLQQAEDALTAAIYEALAEVSGDGVPQ
jgi:phage terminase Nu1 subunit (DNA packaging protein)